MFKLFKFAVATLFAGTGLANAQSLEAFSYGTVATKGDAGFVYMGSQEAYAAKQGLDIDLQSFKGDAILLKALIAGQLDAYIGNPGGPIIAASKGADIKIVGCPWPGLTYALFTKPEVKSVADLKGKAIGVSAPGSLPDLFARAIVMEAGLAPDDVTFTVSGSDSERVAAVSAGIIAAAPSSSEFNAKAPQLGLKMLVHARDVVPKYIRFCLMTRGDLVKDKPELVEKFLAAQMAGFRHALENKDDMLALSYDKAEMSKDDKSPTLIYDEVVASKAVDPDMTVNLENLNWMRDLLVKTGNLKEGFDPASMVDTTILDKAKARLAATK